MNPRLLLAATLGAIAAAGGCAQDAAPARAQWKIFLATDAPVPQFGAQVLVEILDGTTPPQRRILDGSTALRWPLSFGLVPDDVSKPVRLRVRLFRAAMTGADGLPKSDALIDETATLPPIGRGVTTVGLTLPMACFNVAPQVDAAMTCDPATQQLAPEPTLPLLTSLAELPAAGSWPPAARVDCQGEVPAGMKCMVGGAFILGNPSFPPIDDEWDPLPERLTQLSAFALDEDEFTVGQYRILVQAKGLREPLPAGSNPDAPTGLCTYLGKSQSSADSKPVNCVDWAGADSACKALGKRLPTEAEWEYAGGNLQAETPYPWGLEPSFCDHAVLARGRFGIGEPIECLQQGNTQFPPGPVPGGMDQDMTLFGVRNMAGNLAEWVADPFNPYTAPCWRLLDPLCTASSSGFAHGLRGGSWQTNRFLAAVFIRHPSSDDGPSGAVGFRCAISM